MTIRRSIEWIVLMMFLTFSAGGFYYTMHKKYPPLLQRNLVFHSYGMMAPWQSYNTTNSELIAEGQLADGSWERINMDPYYPHLRGERNIREALRTLHKRKRGSYSKLASQVLARERRMLKDYQAVRLFWETWPKSPDGFNAMRIHPHVQQGEVFAASS